MSPNPCLLEEGPATTSAPESGKGTRDEEKGVEPVDWGTFGLLMPVILVLLLEEPFDA